MDLFAWVVLIIVTLGIILVAGAILFAARFKRCPSDMVLVVYGKGTAGASSRCLHGGGVFVIPLVQDYAFLSLTPITIAIPLQGALSQQNIRINVPSTFTVGISTEPAIMSNAAERLLGLNQDALEEMAREIIFGQLRLTVASLKIEEINQDRERFLESIRRNVEPELNKIGLKLINVNITDITDESDYIESIGKKAAAVAINQAKIDVAQELKKGSIGEALAQRDQTVEVATATASSDKGEKQAEADRRVYIQSQEALAIQGENDSKIKIAETNADLAVKRAEAMKLGEIAEREAEAEIQRAQYKSEQERLTAEEIVQVEIQRKKIEISAEAEAEKVRREARGQADAILAKYEAEATGIRKVLDSKAAGYKSLVESCSGDVSAAATLLMVEKIEELTKTQVEAIKNIKIDKVTVWDSGNGNGEGSSTSNFLSSLVKSLPPMQDVAGMAGVDLPGFLGSMKDADAVPVMKTTTDSATSGKKQPPPIKKSDG